MSRVSDDLAVVTLPLKLPALAVARGRPSVGDPLLALGSPLGLGGTVTSGIVSAYRRSGGDEYHGNYSPNERCVRCGVVPVVRHGPAASTVCEGCS